MRYAWPYWPLLLVSVLASFIVAAADVASARLVQPLVDYVIGAEARHWLPWVPVIIMGLALIKGTARFIQGFFIKVAGQRVMQDIRSHLFSHLLDLDLGFYYRTPLGDIYSRLLNDVQLMQRAASEVLVDAPREGITLLGLVGLAFYNDAALAALAFVVLPLALLPVVYISRKVRANTRRSQESMAHLTGTLQECLGGIRLLKALSTEPREKQRFDRQNERYFHFMRKMLKYESAASPAIELVAALGVAAVFWFGLNRVLAGDMTQGELFSFITAMLMMYTPVKRLTKLNNTVQKSLGAAQRVFNLLDEQPQLQEAPHAIALPRVQGDIRLQGVSFAYGEEPALEDINLHIAPGEVVALVGPSGAGKSTLMGLLCRFFDPQQGRILVDGHDLRDISLASLHAQLALVDQDVVLFSNSIRDNIAYGCPQADEQQIEAAARRAHAHAFICQLPQGYDTLVGERGVRLSGGQRQRIAIARALLRDAPVLLLDEATSALDSESEQLVQQALADLMAQRTTLVIAHRLATILHAQRVVVLDEGRIMEQGNHAQLLAANGLYARLYRLQFQETGL